MEHIREIIIVESKILYRKIVKLYKVDTTVIISLEVSPLDFLAQTVIFFDHPLLPTNSL